MGGRRLDPISFIAPHPRIQGRPHPLMDATPASTAGSSPRDGGVDAVPAASVAGLGPPLKDGLLYRESTVVPGIAKKRHAVLYR